MVTTRRGLTRTAATLVVALAVAAPASAEVIDRILAIVDGQLVTLSDAHAALALRSLDVDPAADPVAAAIAALVERHLVLAEVERYALPEPDEGAIETRAEALRAALAARVGGVSLSQVALSAERLREIARNDVRIDAYLGQRFRAVQSTDAEVEAYYRSHPELFTRGGVQLPFVEVRAEAQQRLGGERRRQLIDDWVADLRRRAEINVLYLPVTGRP